MQKLHCAVGVQSCLTLCKPMDYGPPGSSVHGVFQAGIWSGFPFPTLGDLPDPGIKPTCLASPALAGEFFTSAPPWKPENVITLNFIIYPKTTKARLYKVSWFPRVGGT